MINYVVNKEKRTVVAFFADEDGGGFCGRDLLFYDLIRHLHSKFKKSSFFDMLDEDTAMNIIVELVDEFMIKYVPEENCIKGIAKCNPEDVFEESFGIIIARDRLIEKERNIFNKFRKYFNEKLTKMFDQCKY